MVLPRMTVWILELVSLATPCITSVLRVFISRPRSAILDVCQRQLLLKFSRNPCHNCCILCILHVSHYHLLCCPNSLLSRNDPPSHLYFTCTPPDISRGSALRTNMKVTGSRNTLKRTGASTQPCLTPIVTSNVSEYFPLLRGVLYKNV